MFGSAFLESTLVGCSVQESSLGSAQSHFGEILGTRWPPRHEVSIAGGKAAQNFGLTWKQVGQSPEKVPPSPLTIRQSQIILGPTTLNDL